MHATLLDLQSARGPLPQRASPHVVRGAPAGTGADAGPDKIQQWKGGAAGGGAEAGSRPFTISRGWMGEEESLPGAVRGMEQQEGLVVDDHSRAGTPSAGGNGSKRLQRDDPGLNAVERMSRTPPQSAMRRGGGGAFHVPAGAGGAGVPGDGGSRRGAGPARNAHWKEEVDDSDSAPLLAGAAAAAAGGGRSDDDGSTLSGGEEVVAPLPSPPPTPPFRPHQVSTFTLGGGRGTGADASASLLSLTTRVDG